MIDSEKQQPIDREKPITNPVMYIDEFRKSKIYEQEFTKFITGKKYTEAYPNEMRDVFERMENTRQCLIRYAREGKMLSYDKSEYEKKGEGNPLTDYFGLIKEYRQHPERYDALGYDSLRGQYHDKATQFISENFHLPNHLSIGIVQILAISQGLESFGGASQDRIKALTRTL